MMSNPPEESQQGEAAGKPEPNAVLKVLAAKTGDPSPARVPSSENEMRDSFLEHGEVNVL